MNAKITTTCAVALAALVATTLPALAHGPDGREGRSLPEWLAAADTDGDGKLSKAERYEHKKARFATFDANGDGNLSADELGAMIEDMRKRRHERMLSRLDTDGDGTVTGEEFARADFRKMMRKAHHGGDGPDRHRRGWFNWSSN